MRGLVAAAAAVTIFGFGLSLTLPLLAILMDRMGASAAVVGVHSAASAAAILIAGPILPGIMARIGMVRLLVGAAATMAALFLVFPLVPVLWVWFVVRFVFGCAATAMFYGSETWIITAAPPARRGLVLGLYSTSLAAGFAAGPALLSLIGTEGPAPFVAAACITLAATIPIIWARRGAPDLRPDADAPETGVRDVLRFVKTDPAILGAVALFGAVESGVMGLFPVWALGVGLTEATALTLVMLLAIGNMGVNIPMGLISDRFDRTRLLMICALGSIAAAVLIPLLSQTVWPLRGATMGFGGLAVGLYIFALHELGSRYSGDEFARGNGAVMAAYGFGSLIGPPVMGLMNDIAPPHGMFGVLAAAAALYLAVARRESRRPG